VVILARDQLEVLLKNNADGLPLAIRLVLTGRTRAHGELFGLETQLRDEILSAANMLSESMLWIEKVILNTEPELDATVIEARFDALSDLQNILARAGSDVEIRQRIDDELKALIGKAPLELIEAVPELDIIRSGNIDELLEHVSQALIARMSGDGERQ